MVIKKKYYKRNIEKLLGDYLKAFPVVCITGPRQSGKSTLIKEITKGKYHYVTMDDISTREFFNTDPVLFMESFKGKVIFDEAQKTPELFEYIKMKVDEDRNKYGQFILSGSSQFTLTKNIRETLAGRVGMLTLLPFEFSEIPEKNRKELIWAGSYPELVLRKFSLSEHWYHSYIETYINRDVKDISNIGNVRDFSRCLRLLAARAGQMINISTLARDLGISQPTVKHWISILETSYIIFLLPPFYKNFGKRIIKSPKIYFYDTGLITYLNKIHSEELLEHSSMKGEVFENFIIAEYMKMIAHSGRNEQLYFLRTNHGVEIDLIVDHGATYSFIEIKSSMTFKKEYILNMEKISPKNNKQLIYKGKNMIMKDELKILNYMTFLEGFSSSS